MKSRHLCWWSVSEGGPSEGSGKEGVSPPRVVPNQVRGTYLEVADHKTPLLQEVLRRGLEVHQMSGVVDVAWAEPFDDVEVAVEIFMEVVVDQFVGVERPHRGPFQG